MKNFLFIGFLSVISFVVLYTVWPAGNKDAAVPKKKLSVVATFYPLEDFARAVGGDFADVVSIVPAGAESHEYEPTPRDILAAYQADVFLLNGAGFDAWAEKIRPDLEARGVRVVDMSQHMELLPGGEEHEEEEETEESKNEHENEFFDPHFWLDPVLAEREVWVIAEAFGERDPGHRERYIVQASAYVEKLRALDRSYLDGLLSCRLNAVIASHNAFSYMAKRYDFEVIAIAGLSPEAEAPSRRLADLSRLAREKGIQHIFFETLVSPKVAETLAREVGAETLVFNPIEGLTDLERIAGKEYLAIMEENLENLKIARQCRK